MGYSFYYGLTCTKAGEVPLQGTCGEFDSLWVHIKLFAPLAQRQSDWLLTSRPGYRNSHGAQKIFGVVTGDGIGADCKSAD